MIRVGLEPTRIAPLASSFQGLPEASAITTRPSDRICYLSQLNVHDQASYTRNAQQHEINGAYSFWTVIVLQGENGVDTNAEFIKAPNSVVVESRSTSTSTSKVFWILTCRVRVGVISFSGQWSNEQSIMNSQSLSFFGFACKANDWKTQMHFVRFQVQLSALSANLVSNARSEFLDKTRRHYNISTPQCGRPTCDVEALDEGKAIGCTCYDIW